MEMLSIKEIIAGLSSKQIVVAEHNIRLLTLNLSNRARNAVNNHLDGYISLKKFTEKGMLSNNFEVTSMKNIGSKTEDEINKYIDDVSKAINYAASLDDKDIRAMEVEKRILEFAKAKDLPDEIASSGSIFVIAEYLIDKIVYGRFNKAMLNDLLLIYENNNGLTLTDIGKKYGITRERVRQIRNKSLKLVEKEMANLSNICFDDSAFYQLLGRKNVVSSNNQVFFDIKNANNVLFSSQMVFYVLSQLLINNYDFLGSVEDLLLANKTCTKKRYVWKNCYLIDKNNDVKIVQSFVEDLNKAMNRTIEEDTAVYPMDYILDKLPNIENDKLTALINVVFQVAFAEFSEAIKLIDFSFDERKILLRRNTRKLTNEYSYEALEYLGIPSSVADIAKAINLLNPDLNITELKVRPTLSRDNGFVPMGRSSIFALKKWESERKGFKVGTIRDIVQEYLELFTEPQHISKITEHVKRYRPKTKEVNIINNLRLDTRGVFVLFEKNRFGLSSRSYSDEFIPLNELSYSKNKTWEQRYKELKHFINAEKRLPKSTAKLKEEVRLYRWLHVQYRFIRMRQLSDKKKSLLEKLLASNNL